MLTALAAGQTTGDSKPLIVMAGGGVPVFVPNLVNVAQGGKIEFQFNKGQHTATQASLDGGCQPLVGGFHSGKIAFVDGQQEVGTFTLQVNDTKPMAVICTTGPHRQLAQVMLINGYDSLPWRRNIRANRSRLQIACTAERLFQDVHGIEGE